MALDMIREVVKQRARYGVEMVTGQRGCLDGQSEHLKSPGSCSEGHTWCLEGQVGCLGVREGVARDV